MMLSALFLNWCKLFMIRYHELVRQWLVMRYCITGHRYSMIIGLFPIIPPTQKTQVKLRGQLLQKTQKVTPLT